MLRSFLYILLLCCIETWWIEASAQSVTEKLKAIGMENIRYAETGECITVTFENNVYRSTYQGIGEAIDACLESNVNKSNWLHWRTKYLSYASVCRTPC